MTAEHRLVFSSWSCDFLDHLWYSRPWYSLLWTKVWWLLSAVLYFHLDLVLEDNLDQALILNIIIAEICHHPRRWCTFLSLFGLIWYILLQICALFWCTFTGPYNVVVYRNWQISGVNIVLYFYLDLVLGGNLGLWMIIVLYFILEKIFSLVATMMNKS